MTRTIQRRTLQAMAAATAALALLTAAPSAHAALNRCRFDPRSFSFDGVRLAPGLPPGENVQRLRAGLGRFDLSGRRGAGWRVRGGGLALLRPGGLTLELSGRRCGAPGIGMGARSRTVRRALARRYGLRARPTTHAGVWVAIRGPRALVVRFRRGRLASVSLTLSG